VNMLASCPGAQLTTIHKPPTTNHEQSGKSLLSY
jgi:hypothetical protein